MVGGSLKHESTVGIVKRVAEEESMLSDEEFVRRVAYEKLQAWFHTGSWTRARGRDLGSKAEAVVEAAKSWRPDLNVEMVRGTLRSCQEAGRDRSDWEAFAKFTAFFSQHPDWAPESSGPADAFGAEVTEEGRRKVFGLGMAWTTRQEKRAEAMGMENAKEYRAEIRSRLVPRGSIDLDPVSPNHGSPGSVFVETLQEASMLVQRIWDTPVDHGALKDMVRAGMDELDGRPTKKILASGLGAWGEIKRTVMGASVFDARLDAAMERERRESTRSALKDVHWLFMAQDPTSPSNAASYQRMTLALRALAVGGRIDPESACIPLEKGLVPLMSVDDPVNVDRWTWLGEVFRDVIKAMPLALVEQGGFAKLVRTMIGIFCGIMSSSEFGSDSLSRVERDEAAFIALQLGFYFGLSYPFGDDVLDNNDLLKVFNMPKQGFGDFLGRFQDMLWRGEPDLRGETGLPAHPVKDLLTEALDSLSVLLGERGDAMLVFQNCSVMLHAQRYELLYPDAGLDPLVLAAARTGHTYLTVSALFGQPRNNDCLAALHGLLGQMFDDLQDIMEDIDEGTISTFTCFLRESGDKARKGSPLTFLLKLCSYFKLTYINSLSVDAFLGRRLLRSLRVWNDRGLSKEWQDMMARLRPDKETQALLDTIWEGSAHIIDPDKGGQQALTRVAGPASVFHRDLKTAMADYQAILSSQFQPEPLSDDHHALNVAARNYVLTGTKAKRVRPALVLMMADLFGIERTKVLPLAKAVEYLHTSSLVFDDGTAQDCSDTRRGRPTLHTSTGSSNADAAAGLSDSQWKTHERNAEGRAQNAALSVIAMAVAECTALGEHFEAESVMRVVRFISDSMKRLADGQALDLHCKEWSGVNESVLRTLAKEKTGTAFAISMEPVVMLAGQNASLQWDVSALALEMGVLFQISDDLLDCSGADTGKPMGLDLENGSRTFVTELGEDGARAALEASLEQCKTISYDLARRLGRPSNMIDQLLSAIAYRDK